MILRGHVKETELEYITYFTGYDPAMDLKSSHPNTQSTINFTKMKTFHSDIFDSRLHLCSE